MGDARVPRHLSRRQRDRPTGSGADGRNPFALCAAGLLVPGLGHLLLDRRGTAAVFFGSIGLLFAFGIAMEGELFPLEAEAPLTLLAALAEMGSGGFYVAARLLGLGGGDAAASSYEYGYAYLIVAGLLNLLVVLDAWDLATGAKQAPAADRKAGPAVA